MFIKTQDNTLINMNSVAFINVTKYLNMNKATLKAYMDGITLDVYTGSIGEAEDAFHTLEEGLIKKAQLISYSEEDI